jgi:hypothetical protein
MDEEAVLTSFTSASLSDQVVVYCYTCVGNSEIYTAPFSGPICKVTKTLEMAQNKFSRSYYFYFDSLELMEKRFLRY